MNVSNKSVRITLAFFREWTKNADFTEISAMQGEYVCASLTNQGRKTSGC